MLHRLAHLTVRHRWPVIGAWLLLTLFGGFAAARSRRAGSQSIAVPGKPAYEASQRTLNALGAGARAPERRRLPHQRRRDEEPSDRAGHRAHCGGDARAR